MNKDYFNRIRRRDPKSDIYFSEYSIEKGIVAVKGQDRELAMNKIQNILTDFISKDKILIWK